LLFLPECFILKLCCVCVQGKSEFIGRAMAKPHVKLLDEPYELPKFPPKLEWFDINRGVDHAGELLAMFEMLEVRRPDFRPRKWGRLNEVWAVLDAILAC
jgi:hypothetical protein